MESPPYRRTERVCVALFYGPVPRLSMLLGAVALVVAPLALLVATFGDRYRGVDAT